MTSHPTSVAPAPADRAEATSRLRLAVGRLSRRMRQESSHGRSLTQIGILATLDRAGSTTLGDLAAIERVSPPTITKAVGTLVGEGLVEKVPDPDDRRVCRAVLTGAGRRDLDAMRNRRDAWLATRLAALDEADLARLVELVPMLEALTTGEPPPDDPTEAAS